MLLSSNFNELVSRTPRAQTLHSHKGGLKDRMGIGKYPRRTETAVVEVGSSSENSAEAA